ncbi:hypothetical protein [Rhizobium leguminosarum]|uniref:Uncharacterized protein n=1 Tax=Rhizobium leguminosarum TaxID=384 RepID=A0A7M3DQN4_RHILE|nr:hypothetical protein [Rhizobium leguminosarum]TAY50940.1 hypothetical protein ELH90_04070 [Rhizobium leguminosarum]
MNAKFPPVTVDDHRKTAIGSVASTLPELVNANVAANLRLSDLGTAMNSAEVKEKLGISDLTLHGDRQILFADVSVDRTFTASDFPDLDATTVQILTKMSPQIKGTVSIGLGVTSAVTTKTREKLEIDFRLLPLFRSLHVDKVVLADKVDLAKAAEVIASLLNRYADNVSGALSEQEFTKISVPAELSSIGETNASFSLTDDNGTAKLDVSTKPITPPVFLRSVAFLVDAEGFSVLADLAPTGTETATPSAGGNMDYPEIRKRFADILVANFGLPDPFSQNWIAVSKALVATIVNSAADQAKPCFDLQASLAEQTFSQKIEIPDETTINCTPTMDCTPTRDCTPIRDCTPTENCEQTTDCNQTENCEQNRSCRKCVFGICGNDPVCETEKAIAKGKCEAAKATRKGQCEATKVASKGTCEAGKEARRVDCERLKTSEKAACETQKTSEKALCESEKTGKKIACETGKEALKRVSRLGNLANLDGKFRASGRLDFCVTHLQLSPTMEQLEASFDVKGYGAADASLKYVPLDIAGHIVCVADWTEDKHITVALPRQELKVSSTVTVDTSGKTATLKAHIKTSDLTVQLRPGPAELIQKSYNMRLSCPAVGWLVNDATLDISKSLPEMRGDLELPGQERDLNAGLGKPEIAVNNYGISGAASYSVNAKALIITGTLAPPP